LCWCFVFMTLFAPRFFNVFNLTSIMKVVAMNACVAIGFTIVMICGQLDLSIGTVITFAGVLGLPQAPLGYACRSRLPYLPVRWLASSTGCW
jgi:ribose/xylose/arabinose/galactoside ABC-type transport system permease subunit